VLQRNNSIEMVDINGTIFANDHLSSRVCSLDLPGYLGAELVFNSDQHVSIFIGLFKLGKTFYRIKPGLHWQLWEATQPKISKLLPKVAQVFTLWEGFVSFCVSIFGAKYPKILKFRTWKILKHYFCTIRFLQMLINVFTVI